MTLNDEWSGGGTDTDIFAVSPMINDHHPGTGKQGGLHGWLEKKRVACDEAVASGDLLKQFTAEPDKGHAHALERFIDEILGIGPVVLRRG